MGLFASVSFLVAIMIYEEKLKTPLSTLLSRGEFNFLNLVESEKRNSCLFILSFLVV